MMDNRSDAEQRSVRLAIAIPAFGRAEAIAKSIASMALEARTEQLDVAFYVSDDTPDDSVRDALDPLMKEGFPIQYRKNSPSYGHDKNLLTTVIWPDADYVWLMGSALRVAEGKLATAYSFLGHQDLVFYNVNAPEQPNIDHQTGDRARALLRDMLWHQTRTGATVYGRNIRQWIKSRLRTMTVVNNFPQICAMMDFASHNNVSVGWCSDVCLSSSESSSGSYWYSKAIDVFVYDWADAVASFPIIVDARNVTRVTREHSRRTDLFTTHHLTLLRESKQFGWKSLADHRFHRAMHLPIWKTLAVLVLPLYALKTGGVFLARLKQLRA